MTTSPLTKLLFRVLLLAVGVAILFQCGCSTTGLQRGASALKIAARRGTFEYVKRHPERRPLFEVAAASLTALVNTNADYSTLAVALQTLKIREFKGDEGALLLRDGLDLLDLAIADLKPGDGSGVRVVAQALADGIAQGLAMLPVMAPLPPRTAIRPGVYTWRAVQGAYRVDELRAGTWSPLFRSVATGGDVSVIPTDSTEYRLVALP